MDQERWEFAGSWYLSCELQGARAGVRRVGFEAARGLEKEKRIICTAAGHDHPHVWRYACETCARICEQEERVKAEIRAGAATAFSLIKSN